MKTAPGRAPRSRTHTLAITALKAIVSFGLLWLLISRVDV
jgi:hypothetical protein